MIGTDYGHHDPSSVLNAIRLLRNGKRIGPSAVTKILETNPRNFYGLTFTVLMDAADPK
jgi:hypothetical protein